MAATRLNIFIPFVDMLLVVVAVLIVSIAPTKKTDGVHVEAEYLVSITWDRMLNDDVDLWAQGPPDMDKPVFFRSPEGGAMHLDRDSRGYMDDRQWVDGKHLYLPHKEITTLRGIIPGRYNFGIQLYANKDGDNQAPRDMAHLGIVVHYEVVKLNPKVEVIAQGDETLDRYAQGINIWSMDVLADGSYTKADLPVEPIASHFLRVGSGAPHPVPNGGIP